jgi:hypothetical protein
MFGIIVFTSVAEALRAGFQICDKTEYGYLARTATDHGWAVAEIHLKVALVL